MIKKILNPLLCALMLTSSSLLLAEWDPEFIEDADTSVLDDKNYNKLKKSIFAALKGSWCSQEKANLLMDLVLLEQPKVCVEIGAFTGSSMLPVAATLQFLQKGKVYAIDAWDNTIATQFWDDKDPNKAWWSSIDMEAIHDIYLGLVKQWNLKNYSKELRMSSEEAVSQIDEIDFLHLDGDYSEIGSLQDVSLYLPKVKSGGYILLSNLFTMINGKQPKLASFTALLEECEIVCDIERDNAILFKKY